MNAPLDHSRIPEPWIEEPDPKLPPWASGATWTVVTLFSLLALYGAGQCLMMAWKAING